MPVNPEIVEALAIANMKTVAEQPALLANIGLSNQIFNQNLQQQSAMAEMQAMGIARLSAVKSLSEYNPMDPSQARSEQHALTGDSVASQMQALLAALNSGGQGVKSLTVTPPVGDLSK